MEKSCRGAWQVPLDQATGIKIVCPLLELSVFPNLVKLNSELCFLLYEQILKSWTETLDRQLGGPKIQFTVDGRRGKD